MNRLLRTSTVRDFMNIYRETHNLSLREFAKLTDQSISTLSEWHKGREYDIAVDLAAAVIKSTSPRLLDSEHRHLADLVLTDLAQEYEKKMLAAVKKMEVK